MLCSTLSGASAGETWTAGRGPKMDEGWGHLKTLFTCLTHGPGRLKADFGWQCGLEHIHGAWDSHSMTAGFPESTKCKYFKRTGLNRCSLYWPSLVNHQQHFYILLIIYKSLQLAHIQGEELNSTSWWKSGQVTLQKACGIWNTVVAIFGKQSLPQHKMNI